MKFKISVSELQKAMKIVRDVSPATGPTAADAGVRIEAKEDCVTFYALGTGLSIMAVVKVKVDVEKEGTVVCDPNGFYSAISHFKDDKDGYAVTGEITVSLAPRARKLQVTALTKYSSGVSTPHKRVFPLKDATGFMGPPATSKVKSKFELPPEVLAEGISSITYAVSADQQQMMFTGILMVIEEDNLTLFSTNGVCLAEYSVNVAYTGDPLRIVIPGPLSYRIAKLFTTDTALSLLLTKGMLYTCSPDLTIGGSLIGDEYPNYKAVLPVPTEFAAIDKNVFLDNLLSLTYEASLIDDNRVSVLIENGEVFLRCSFSENRGIPAKSKTTIAFDCNLKLLVGSIKNVFGDIVTIGFAGKGLPLTFTGSTSSIGASLSSVLVPLTV